MPEIGNSPGWYTGQNQNGPSRFNLITVSSAYTATSWDLVLATAALTVTLPTNPTPGDMVAVIRVNNLAVTVAPGGGLSTNTINGSTSSIALAANGAVTLSQPIVVFVATSTTSWTIFSEVGEGLTQQQFMQAVNFLNVIDLYPTTITGASYTTTGNNYNVLLCNYSGNCALQLSSGATGALGRFYWIKNINAAGYVVVSPQSGTIDGQSSYTLAPYQAIQVVSDGTNWWIMREDPIADVTARTLAQQTFH
jgi:hypothetical protein